MRYNELYEGIEVVNENEQVIGTSRAAGLKVCCVLQLLLYMMFYKKAPPFCFFYKSVKWWSICMKFLPDVAEEIQIQNISTKKFGC